MSKDPNTPDWVQHLALQVGDMETLLAAKARLEKGGVKVIGPKIGHLCTSIYFFDPNGHRLELCIIKAEPNEMTARDARRILDRWTQTKQPVVDVLLECPI